MPSKFIGFKQAISRGYLRAGALVGSALVAVPAFATTDPFDTAMATSTTKVGGYAAALVGLAAVSVAFLIAVKYVKKIRGAA